MTLDQYIKTLDSRDFRVVQDYMMNSTHLPIDHVFTVSELTHALGVYHLRKCRELYWEAIKSGKIRKPKRIANNEKSIH